MNRSRKTGIAPTCWSKVDSRMRVAAADVHERAEREQVLFRDAAYLIAAERVSRAYRERGWE